MKRHLLTIALVATLAAVAGCGGGDDPPAAPEPTGPAATTPAAGPTTAPTHAPTPVEFTGLGKNGST